MEKLHTPGQWKLFYQDDDIFIESDKSTAAICSLEGHRGSFPGEADAKLIVKAVNCHEELLAAVRGLINDIKIQNINADDDYLKRMHPHIDLAMNAIKKATE